MIQNIIISRKKSVFLGRSEKRKKTYDDLKGTVSRGGYFLEGLKHFKQ